MLSVAPVAVNDGFFRTLSVCVVISLAALAAATALHFPPVVGMVGGALPLVYYHIFFLSPRARRGLSGTAIDSVYYFGFLVTIGALGASAMRLATSGGKEPMETIAFQFGLGLLATGYAVLARMHLTSISSAVDQTGPEAVLDRYLQRSVELISNVELASTQFVTLANSLMAKSEEVAERAQASAEKAMLELARHFDDELRKTLASGREGLGELRALVSDAAFNEERQELAKSIKLTLEHVQRLNESLEQFAGRATEGSRGAAMVAVSAQRASGELDVLSQRTAVFAGPDGQFVQAASAFTEAHAEVAEATQVLGGLVRDLKESAQEGTDVRKAVKNIKTLVTTASDQMTILTETTTRLQEASGNLAKTALITNTFAGSLDRAAAAAPKLTEGLEDAHGKLASLAQAAASLQEQLVAIPKPALEAVQVNSQLQESLRTVQQLLAGAALEAKAMAGATAQNAQSLQVAQSISSSLPQLKSTAEAIEGMLSSLSGTLQSVQQGLHSTTTALEKDIEQSGRAARLFVERLTDSAQVILDHTRQQGARPV